MLPYTAKVTKKAQPVKPGQGIPTFEEYQESKTKSNPQKPPQKGKQSFNNRDGSEENVRYKVEHFDPSETYNVSGNGTFNGRFTNTGENRYVYEGDDHEFDNEVIEEEEYTQGGGHNSTFQRLDQSDRMNDTQHFDEFPKKNTFRIENQMNIDKIALFK